MTKVTKFLKMRSCWNYVFTAFPYEDLGTKGFSLSRELDAEENGVTTQSLLVNSSNDEFTIKLDFYEIKDEEEFMRSLKTGSKQKGGRDLLRPGICFEGANDQHLTIGTIPLEIINTKNNLNLKVEHANSVQKLFGIYLGLKENEIKEWSQFLELEPDSEGWQLLDGTKIFIAQPGDGLFEYMQERKDFPFWGVFLKSHSLKKFSECMEPDNKFLWNGKEVFQIKEHLTDWDLLVVE